MDDLVERLLTAIDAKAQRAEAALGSVWTALGREVIADDDISADGRVISDGDGRDGGVFDEDTAAFIGDNDPKTVLDRCAADRIALGICRYAQGMGAADAALVGRRVIYQLAESYGITETEGARRG